MVGVGSGIVNHTAVVAVGEFGMTRPADPAVRWRLPLVVLGLLLVPVVIEVVRRTSVSQKPAVQRSVVPSETEANRIRETVVRYQISHLAPNDLAPAALAKITGYCVGLDRAGGIDPPASLLEALKDVPLPVAAHTSCVKEGMRGRIPLWVVSISMSSADTAQVVGRASQNAYVYALERGRCAGSGPKSTGC